MWAEVTRTDGVRMRGRSVRDPAHLVRFGIIVLSFSACVALNEDVSFVCCFEWGRFVSLKECEAEQ